MITVSGVNLLPNDFAELADRARSEGFRFIDRLIVDFNSAANTFSAPGEAFFEARNEGKLVGVGGLNRDPYAADGTVGRVRRVYVDPADRGKGIGVALMDAIEATARRSFRELHLFTDTVDAANFYSRLGYRVILCGRNASHSKTIA